MEWLISYFDGLRKESIFMVGLVGGVVLSMLNNLGALMVLLWQKPSDRTIDFGLGVAAGIMLCASFTSLIIPGIEYGGIVPVIIGIVFGAVFLDLSDHLIPHLHKIMGYEGGATGRIKALLLFIIAITIHNAPEGLSVGVAFGSGDIKNAVALMLGIGIQNIPEGFAVAVAAISMNFGKRFLGLWTGVRAGLIEIPMAVIGAIAVSFFSHIVPYAMGFAAGAMLYVVSDEIVPETHSRGYERAATWGIMLGLLIMLTLDIVLSP